MRIAILSAMLIITPVFAAGFRRAHPN